MSDLAKIAEQLQANINRLPQSQQVPAVSLLRAYRSERGMTDKQLNYMLSLHDQAMRETDDTPPPVFKNIRALMDHAASREDAYGVKIAVEKVRIRLLLPNSMGEIILKRYWKNQMIYVSDMNRKMRLNDGRQFARKYGTIDLAGKFQKDNRAQPDIVKAVVEALTKFDADPLKVAKVEGQATNRCMFCARRLTDATSVEVGYGATCASNYGLPWGDQPGSNSFNVFKAVANVVYPKEGEDVKVRLPAVLAEHFCADYVSDIPRDIRVSSLKSWERVFAAPENYPKADWKSLEKLYSSALSLSDVWSN